MQLHALLESIQEHAEHLFRTITVLIYPPAWMFNLSYFETFRNYRGVEMWQQGDFQEDVTSWIENAGEHVCFLVDDDLFIRPAPPVKTVIPRENECCYSLRLENVNRSWRWQAAHEIDYQYPLALDGHIFRTGEIVVLLDFDYTDPTRLEAGLAARADRLERPLMAAGAERCLIGVPANRVSPSSGMPYHARGDTSWSPSALAVAYLDGVRLDRAAMQAELEASEDAHCSAELRFGRSALAAVRGG